MRSGTKPVGILAVQGDFALHAEMLDRIGAAWKLVKHASELEEVSGLIMPGGESTTMLKFFENEGLGPAIRNFAASVRPIFGTCAGTILLAKDVLNPPQERLGLIDITVERNGYGAFSAAPKACRCWWSRETSSRRPFIRNLPQTRPCTATS
jgi:5'-phosphate synthase pdxT subunit